MLRLTIILFLSFFQTALFAQRNCGTELYNQDILEEYPELSGRYGRTNADTELNEKLTRLEGVIKIPVVIHIVYNTPEQNLSDDEINSQIKQLNLDFSAKNLDLSKIPSPFKDKIANCEIEFELKKITRTQTTKTKFLIKFKNNERGEKIYNPNYEPIKFSPLGGVDGLPCTQFLNVWVGNISDGSPYQLLGYAAFPGGLCEFDGVVIHHNYFGTINSKYPFNKGRTLTHEVGHWLNLRHIWGDASCGNDLIDDTPTQQTSNSECPTFPFISCNNSPSGDMFMNYMDYVNDECMFMFTTGQKNRMRSLFIEGGDRAYFLTNSLANRQLLVNDAERNDIFTPTITEFKKYFHCKPVHDTCKYAFVFWTQSEHVKEYKVYAKKVNSDTWKVINTPNNYIKISGLGSHVLYEIKVQAVLENGTYSAESTPYVFKLKGTNPFSKFKSLKLIP